MFLHVFNGYYLFVDVRKVSNSCYPVAVSRPEKPKAAMFCLSRPLSPPLLPSFLPDTDNNCQNNIFSKPFKARISKYILENECIS